PALELAGRISRLTREGFGSDGRPQEEEVEVEEPQPPRRRVAAGRAGAQHLPPLRQRQAAPRRVPELRLLQGPRRCRRRLVTGSPSPSTRWVVIGARERSSRAPDRRSRPESP